MSATADQGPDIPFGPEVGGLRAAVLVRSSYRPGEAIVPTLVIANVSSTTLTVYSCGFYPNHEIRLTSGANRDVPKTSYGREALGLFDPKGPRRKNVPIDIAPGEQHTLTFPRSLTDLFVLEAPGEYHLQVFYEDHTGPPWQGRLASNVATFRIGK